MQYLIFGMLLILGAVSFGLCLYLSHVKNQVQAVVCESYCDIKRMEQEIEEIRVTHVLELELTGENRRVETELLPVRELNGAKLSVHYNRKKQELYIPDDSKYYPLLGAFGLSGVICFVLYFCGQKPLELLYDFSKSDWLAFLLGVIAVVAFSYVTTVINPAVLRIKGNFEGILKSGDEYNEVEVYSLWYGEHRQYAKRIKGMLLKQSSGKTITLFYNTKNGYAFRVNELVISMGVSAVAFLAMMIVLLVF